MQNNRGKIIHRERASQLRDYRGLRFGNITPTDIDGFIEYHNKAYVLYELKLENAEVPYGQRLALERLTNDLEKVGKPTLCIIASHDVHDCSKDIDVANASVIEYRLKGKWTLISPGLTITTRKMTELFFDNLGIGSEDFHQLCVRNSNQLNMNEIKIPTKSISLAEFVRERRGK